MEFEKRITGLLTATGVLLGFMMTFFTNWFTGGGKWSCNDIPALICFFLAMIIMIVVLYRGLMFSCYNETKYKWMVWLFIIGIVIFLSGIALEIVMEFIANH